MRTSLLRHYIRQVLSEAYSPGLVSSLKKKWRAEVPTLTDQQIEAYIDTFDRHKNSEPVRQAKGPDITQYTWSELETLLDANFSTRSAHEIKIEGDLEPVYKSPDSTLQVFLGDRREKCIKIRQDFETRSGRQYTWCISKSDASNMFTSYRFRLEEPVFYYVFDTDRDAADPLHACVIYVDSGGKYFLSDARNKGDKQHSWSELVQMMPKLGQIKSVFKHIPLSSREREIYEKVGNELSDKDFFNLSRDLKEEYIGFGHELTDAQLRNVFSLPDGKELINKYCNMRQNVFLPLDIYNKLPSSTKKVIEKNFELDLEEIYELWYLGKKDISGNLDLFNTKITSLPVDLRVSGNLNLAYTKITSLPEGLRVGGNLDLSGTKITSLPEGLRVGGNLNLLTTKITSLPEGLRVGGDLNLSYTKITSLPEDLQVGGSIMLNSAPITSLPMGLEVKGNLELGKTHITSLPAGLKVKGDLGLSGTNITSLPEGLRVGGSLGLALTTITSLPKGLSVGKHLILSHSKITSFPDDLKVGGSIMLDYTPITSLPMGLDVKGNLELGKTHITSLPAGLKVKGDLGLYGNQSLATLPEGLRVGGRLDLSYTKITSLPAGLKVKGNLDLSGTKITSLPVGLRVGGNLKLFDTKITSLPQDLYVGGGVTPDKFQIMYDEMKAQTTTESALRSFVRQMLT